MPELILRFSETIIMQMCDFSRFRKFEGRRGQLVIYKLLDARLLTDLIGTEREVGTGNRKKAQSLPVLFELERQSVFYVI